MVRHRRCDVTGSRLDLTRPQILAFRRHVGALDGRLPPGRRSLRRAAWAGLQDSMPRAALLSIHARVEGTEPSTWGDPSLVQLWGPRFSAYVVPARDLAVFSLGRLPDDAKGRQGAEDLAERLHAYLDGRRMTYSQAGRALGERPQVCARLRPRHARCVRRVGWDLRSGRLRGVRRAPQVAHPGANTDRRRVDPHPRRSDVPHNPVADGSGTAPPERRRLLPPVGRRSRTPGP